MKRIIVCDSGLGGLNIASRFFCGENEGIEHCELIYFNAYPSATCGFNKLPSLKAQEEVLRDVLESMKKFSPDLCLIACNTLSIVYERLLTWYTPVFPIRGIVDAAVDGMFQALENEPESSLLILGTKSTVESQVYEKRLWERNIAPERIRGLACPGLATLLESDPAALEVQEKIAQYASCAEQLFPGKPEKLFLGLCCTHFGFASDFWIKEFSSVFGNRVALVNPNDLLGTGWKACAFSYHSKIEFFPGARENMSACFKPFAPLIAEALNTAQADRELFNFNEVKYHG